jgi:hypothetical protein
VIRDEVSELEAAGAHRMIEGARVASEQGGGGIVGGAHRDVNVGTADGDGDHDALVALADLQVDVAGVRRGLGDRNAAAGLDLGDRVGKGR